MPMQLQCNNKGCCKMSEALLDKSDDKVYCIECGNEITNMTSFTKTSLKTLGQFKREGKVNSSYAITCPVCNKRSGPELVNDEVCCGACHTNLKLHVNSVLLYNMKQNLQKK